MSDTNEKKCCGRCAAGRAAVDAVAPTEPPPPEDLAARVRALEAANEALCSVLADAAPLSWVALGKADEAHRWERSAAAVLLIARA